jgi:hypothetical protein
MLPFQKITNPITKIAQDYQSGYEKLASLGVLINDIVRKTSDYKSLANLSEINSNRGVLTFNENVYGSSNIKETEDPTKKDRDFENLTYPPDLGNKKFYMRMDFKKYERPSPEIQAEISTIHSICLPLPTQLEDSYRVEYSDYDGGIAATVMNSPNQGVSLAAPARFVSNLVSPMLGGEGRNIVNIASQNLVAALNPNKSVLFNSPDFKRYTFSWVFAPNNLNESQIIRKLIRKIKGSSLPTYAKTSRDGNIAKDYNVFNYPNMVKVYLYPWASKDNLIRQVLTRDTSPEMFQTKHCVIESININYSPENNISFFSEGANSPTFIALTINLTEIELFTGEDFGREGSVVDINKILGPGLDSTLKRVFGATDTELPIEPTPTPTPTPQ